MKTEGTAVSMLKETLALPNSPDRSRHDSRNVCCPSSKARATLSPSTCVQGPPSRLHSAVTSVASDTVHMMSIWLSFSNTPWPGEVIAARGATESTVKITESTALCPAASVADTCRVCLPSHIPDTDALLPWASFQAPSSSFHFTPTALESLTVQASRVTPWGRNEPAAGAVMSMRGASRSTVTFTTSDAVWPWSSSAHTRMLCLPSESPARMLLSPAT